MAGLRHQEAVFQLPNPPPPKLPTQIIMRPQHFKAGNALQAKIICLSAYNIASVLLVKQAF